MAGFLRKHWFRILVHAIAVAPGVRIVWMYTRGMFIVDPVRQITTITGRTALILLLLTLACRPLSRILGLGELLAVRRPLGLYSFGYAAAHFLVFAAWDYQLNLDLLGPALLSQRFVLVGLVAFLLMIPLAITSTKGWIRRLGRRWKTLHWLVYPAAALVIGHFLWLRKDPREPLLYGAALGLLLILRIHVVERVLTRARRGMLKRLQSSLIRSEGG
jgi:sulfoxide reductase heme-binding subunit YedZ